MIYLMKLFHKKKEEKNANSRNQINIWGEKKNRVGGRQNIKRHNTIMFLLDTLRLHEKNMWVCLLLSLIWPRPNRCHVLSLNSSITLRNSIITGWGWYQGWQFSWCCWSVMLMFKLLIEFHAMSGHPVPLELSWKKYFWQKSPFFITSREGV